MHRSLEGAVRSLLTNLRWVGRPLRPRVAALVFLLGALSGCRKQAAGPPPHYVVVRFENLSGDPSLEWVCRASSEFLSRSLAGAMDGPVIGTAALNRLSGTLGPRPAMVPGISGERSAALAAGATRVITGYIEREGGNLRIAATEEDVGTGKSPLVLTAIDSMPIKALNRLAHEFSPAARPYLTSNPDALRFFITGLEGPREEAPKMAERAIQADPNYGPAWLLMVKVYAAEGNRAAAEDAIDRARRQKIDPLDLAELDLDRAALRNDRKGRIEALRRISALSPGDNLLFRSLAETEAAAGEFREASADWKKLSAMHPTDPDAWNQMAYTLAWSGDYAGALEAANEYVRLRPGEANPSDSKGDIQYMYRRFSEAAGSYLEAYAKNREFQNGGALYKAAWAKFEAGDKKGADASFEQFRAPREKAGSADVRLFQADWLYRTGRRREAVDLLRKGQPGPNAAALLVIWDLLARDRATAAKDAAAVGPSTTPLEFSARFAALPSASAAEWEARAERMITGPASAGLRQIATGYALLLDGKKEAALPVWRKIAESGPATDFFVYAIYGRLKGEQPKLALPPDPSGVNPFAALLDSL
jgi:tetratricopeptide (TPR) repeat protein